MSRPNRSAGTSPRAHDTAGAPVDSAYLLAVDALAADFTASLRKGTSNSVPRDALARVGEDDPAAAADAFTRAAGQPDLAGQMELWCPALLSAARPGHAADRLREIADARSASGQRLDLRSTPALPHVLGASNFLSRLLARHPDWVEELAVTGSDLPYPDAPPSTDLPADWESIREAKYRALLRIAARDLRERPFARSFEELSALGDRCLDAALRCASHETGGALPALFALGKLGGRELNFSSDVDLLFIYDSADGGFDAPLNQASATLIRHFKKNLEQPSPEGFIYRVDLGLRPEGGAGPLALSEDATLDYYETFGADWERQMLIRLRGLSGPTALIDRFGQGVRPFVYRRAIAPSAIHGVREMKDRIESERRAAGRDLEADLKEGPGGIRDVEFLVQSFQLFWGGRIPELRTGNTLDGLARLVERDLLPATTAEELSTAYLWLRRAEHALQMAEEQQTQTYPRDPAAQLRLARRMGYTQSEGERARSRMHSDWESVRARIRAHFEELVLREPQ
jgi:glutamate-ammonia-ligase adenylyltransferase